MLQSAAIWNHPNFVSYENGYASLNWINYFASQILVAIHIKVEKVIRQNRAHFVQNRLVSGHIIKGICFQVLCDPCAGLFLSSQASENRRLQAACLDVMCIFNKSFFHKIK